ncbi:MAG: hypothetical protein H6736_14360, partial [Alphaproteobacteria bacterium]|nr:hypothetical protein [Alphaproteobacteria bacterium]
MKWAMALLLVGCGGEGSWEVETYGEPYIEQGIPASAFEDGCSARFSQFSVVITKSALVDGDGVELGGLEAPLTVDVHAPGPHPVGL